MTGENKPCHGPGQADCTGSVPVRPTLAAAACLALALGLAGCGGTAPTSPSAPDSPAPAVTPTSSITAAIVDLTNVERSKAGIDTVQVNARLNTAAQLQADQLADRQILEHEIPGAPYPTPPDRLAAAGYTWQRFGENLASGFATAADATVGWMNSEGHRANILNANFTEIGAAYAVDSTGRPYYVEVFGTPR
jgi:uncharacterized protein YkwD